MVYLLGSVAKEKTEGTYARRLHFRRLPSFDRFFLELANFTNENGSDNLKETIEANYKRVKQEVLSLVASEIERIKNDSNLKGLIKE